MQSTSHIDGTRHGHTMIVHIVLSRTFGHVLRNVGGRQEHNSDGLPVALGDILALGPVKLQPSAVQDLRMMSRRSRNYWKDKAMMINDEEESVFRLN